MRFLNDAAATSMAGMELSTKDEGKSMPEDTFGRHSFKHLRFSVVQIQPVATKFYWLRPFDKPKDEVHASSGLIADIGHC